MKRISGLLFALIVGCSVAATAGAQDTLKKIKSSGTMRAATFQIGHFQYFQTTKVAISELIIKVAVTETPYAVARFDDDWNVRMVITTATINSQFTRGK